MDEQPRNRKGYVMVELDEDDRLWLDGIKDRLEAQHGSRIGKAGALRWLIRQDRESRKKLGRRA